MNKFTKIAALLMALVLCLSFAACGNTPAEPAAPAAPADPAAPAAPAEPEPTKEELLLAEIRDLLKNK